MGGLVLVELAVEWADPERFPTECLCLEECKSKEKHSTLSVWSKKCLLPHIKTKNKTKISANFLMYVVTFTVLNICNCLK